MCHRQMFLTLGSFIAIGGALVLLSLNAECIPPYIYGRTFSAATCTYVTSNFTGQNVCCTPSCTFTYPCAHVTVSYSVQGSSVQGYLRSDYESASRQPSGGVCAKYACDVPTSDNVAIVQAYVTSVTNQTFSCHYNPASTGEVIQNHVSATLVIHAVLWPSLVMIAGLILVGLTRIQSITCWRDDAKRDGGGDDADDKKNTADAEVGRNECGVIEEEIGECSKDKSDEQKDRNSVKDISQSKASVADDVEKVKSSETTVSHA